VPEAKEGEVKWEGVCFECQGRFGSGQLDLKYLFH